MVVASRAAFHAALSVNITLNNTTVFSCFTTKVFYRPVYGDMLHCLHKVKPLILNKYVEFSPTGSNSGHIKSLMSWKILNSLWFTGFPDGEVALPEQNRTLEQVNKITVHSRGDLLWLSSKPLTVVNSDTNANSDLSNRKHTGCMLSCSVDLNIRLNAWAEPPSSQWASAGCPQTF